MRKQAKKVAVLTLGIVFIILGLLGLVLPFLQGILFLVIGLMLISLCIPEVRVWIDKHTERYPKLHPIIHKVESWILKFIGEV